ncbi:MAG: hypoxanthine phosphoribosyltransferase [Deltaproteobacteria bacterium]|nr:MAG: hypoxanthine phosphoribosyltransferase [Deltaproteobacteria bacterium]
MNRIEKRLVFSAQDIAGQVHRLARQISTDYRGQDLVLVGVLKGAFIFLADLIRQLTIPSQVDFVRLASYGTGTTSSGKVKITADIKLEVRDRHVLIVEDIVDSGLTTAFLREHLLARKPHSLKICTLLDKKERRSIAIQLDYVGLQLDEGFLVGYGLDHNEAHRNLPEIYELIQ